MPGSWKMTILLDIYAFIQKIYGLTLAHFARTVNISKLAHPLLFGFLGGICWLLARDRSPFMKAADIAMLAGATEMMQLFVKGRTASFLDFLLDCAGGAGGVVLFLLFISLLRRAEKKAVI
ncbi:hypothetical protein DBT_0975 [Dissulfuribacter thermophilus]|uniref:VanZ-like domain-containing protein n=2 Tax=Dissulfuribacter thermophilus TaxID=1156395 RepID=A0A1B9F702_9BACT|nr:hypothetical protein DBT_0975 [Dissulfuribacter thermophilus]